MSWLDQVKSPMIIRTGDGVEHNPKWVESTRSKEFNVSQFEFPELKGSLLDRREAKGTVYNLTIVFDGEDHLDIAEDFWESCDDKRAWTIIHPLYGSLLVQILNLTQDNRAYNVSTFTGQVMETLTEDAPKMSLDPVDKINSEKPNVDDIFAETFAAAVVPDTSDINTLQDNNDSLYNLGKQRVKLTVDAEEYFNLFNTANAAILDATAEPLAALRAAQAFINYPYQFQDTVYNRIQCLTDQIDLLRVNLETITDPSKKRIFQVYVGAIISAIATASANPQDGDYVNRDQVVAVIATITDAYNQYIEDLDSLQTENGGDPDSFIPDADSLIVLNNLIDFTLANLFDIALNSKQERTIYLEHDSNVILLAHRFYGLDQADEAIDTIINTNNIGLNELIIIKKGRPIKYYV